MNHWIANNYIFDYCSSSRSETALIYILLFHTLFSMIFPHLHFFIAMLINLLCWTNIFCPTSTILLLNSKFICLAVIVAHIVPSFFLSQLIISQLTPHLYFLLHLHISFSYVSLYWLRRVHLKRVNLSECGTIPLDYLNCRFAEAWFEDLET